MQDSDLQTQLDEMTKASERRTKSHQKAMQRLDEFVALLRKHGCPTPLGDAAMEELRIKKLKRKENFPAKS